MKAANNDLKLVKEMNVMDAVVVVMEVAVGAAKTIAENKNEMQNRVPHVKPNSLRCYEN